MCVLDTVRKGKKLKIFFGAETPKTYNSVFGSLEHFLLFFENRGPNIKRFADLFRQVETSQDFSPFNLHIVPHLISSFQNESTRIKKQHNEQDLVTLTALFQKTYASLIQFYGDILKAYTLDGFFI